MVKKKKPAAKGSGNRAGDNSPGGKSKAAAGDDDDSEEEEEEEEGEESDDSEDEADDDSKPKSGSQGEGKKSGSDDEPDLSTASPELQAYIKKLRRENGKHRTRANNLETSYNALSTKVRSIAKGDGESDDTENLSAEEIAEQATATGQYLATENAILQIAVDHGISKDGLKYFKFLMGERLAELEEGEELSDEDLEEVAEAAREATGGKVRAKTSVTDSDAKTGGGKGGKAPNKKTSLTVEQFVKMTIAEKTELRKKDAANYEALMSEAKEKRLFY